MYCSPARYFDFETYGPCPNCAYLINQDGMIDTTQIWFNAWDVEKAIDGLFILIADEEAKIRKDPAARVTEILKQVFGK